MRYGSLEFAYAEPFATALADDPSLGKWVLGFTKFRSRASGTRLLDEDMRAARSAKAGSW